MSIVKIVIVFSLLIITNAMAGLFGQENANAQRIAELLAKRDEKVTTLNLLSNEGLKLARLAEENERAEFRINELEQQIKDGESNGASVAKIQKLNAELDRLRESIGNDSSNSLKAKAKITEESKLKIQAELGSIVGELTGELTGDQSFKKSTSFYYAVLIGMVILGFFVLAFKDESVRRNIFSGEAGIQFVTLFSLVIAIILFGVCGILGGKELSALLGGLSGYILGRTRTPSPSNVSNVNHGG